MKQAKWHKVAVEGVRSRLEWLERVKAGSLLLASQPIVALGGGRFLVYHKAEGAKSNELPDVFVVDSESIFIGELVVDPKAWPMPFIHAGAPRGADGMAEAVHNLLMQVARP